MNARALLAAALLAPSLFACAPGAPAALVGVLPDERVLISLPTDGDAAKDISDEQWSESYLFTARVTDDVNELIGGVLLLVNVITELPPTDVAEDGSAAAWGPYADALDPVETSLYVSRDLDSDVVTWAFGQRPKNAPEAEEVMVIIGEVDAGATEQVNSGRFAIDFSALNALNPNERTTGAFYSEYDVAEEGVVASAAFEGVSDGGEDVDALYLYDQLHGGEGSMDLAWFADGLGEPDEELHFVRSRWLADGQGRADAAITGGSLGDEVAFASECWGDRFNPVYRSWSWAGEEGEIAECAYAEASYPEADSPDAE